MIITSIIAAGLAAACLAGMGASYGLGFAVTVSNQLDEIVHTVHYVPVMVIQLVLDTVVLDFIALVIAPGFFF